MQDSCLLFLILYTYTLLVIQCESFYLFRETTDQLENLVPLVAVDHLDKLVQMAPWEQVVNEESRERPENPDRLDFKVSLEMLEHQDHLDLQDQLENPAKLDLTDLLEQEENPETEDDLDFLETLVPPVPLDLR